MPAAAFVGQGRSARINPGLLRVLFAAIAVILALFAAYIALAMGMVRASGRFDFTAIITIVMAPKPTDVGAIILTMINCAFFSGAAALSYQIKRKAPEDYERVVVAIDILDDERDVTIEQVCEALAAIPDAACAAFTHYRREVAADLECARLGIAIVDNAEKELNNFANRETAKAESEIVAARAIVASKWRGHLPGYFKERPDLKQTEVEPLLADARTTVQTARDHLQRCKDADGALDGAINTALVTITKAVREALKNLNEAAYAGEPSARGVEPSAAAPEAAPRLKLVQPPIDGDCHAPNPAE